MERPFIYLFRTLGGYYFYDVVSNHIVPVTQEQFGILKGTQKGEAIGEETKQKLLPLIRQGYLGQTRVKKCLHPLTSFASDYLERRLGKITLQVTQGCNLRCSYCIYSDNMDLKNQRTHSRKRMSFETAKKAIDFYIQHSIEEERCSVSFYGGEPLLEFNLIQKVVQYIETNYKGKEHYFGITTNGTLLTPEVTDYLVGHHFDIMISLDGPEEIQNISRRYARDGKGTYARICSNLTYFYETYPREYKNLSLSMVINPANSKNKIEELFQEKLFENMEIHSAIVDDIYSMEKIEFSDEFIEEQEYDEFLVHLKLLDEISGKYFSPMQEELLHNMESELDEMELGTPLLEVFCPGGPCLPGQMRLFCDVNGSLFPCERVSESSSVMKIGTIHTGFDYEQVKKLLNISALTEEQCKNCFAIRKCGLCAKNCDAGNELSAEVKREFCKGIRSSFADVLVQKASYQEICKRKREVYEA